MFQRFTATQFLVALNAVVFLAGELSPEVGAFLKDHMALYFFRSAGFGPWQFLTHMFLHANFTHLLLNMFGLFSFGSLLERIWGPKRFLIFFLTAGLGAGLIHTAVQNFEYQSLRGTLAAEGLSAATFDDLAALEDSTAFANRVLETNPAVLRGESLETMRDFYALLHTRMVGASGAIYGILTAFGLLFPNAKLSLIFLPIPVAAKYFIPALLVMDLLSGVTGFSIFGGGIAHFAHLGGALIGFLLMLLWRQTTWSASSSNGRSLA